MKESLKVGVSGVRGIVGQSLTPPIACAFAEAFGTFVGRGIVVVGRDTRPSGRMIEHAVVAGLLATGCRPLLAGVAPTPTILFLTRQLGARGGICITASHNSAPWNALKFAGPAGVFLDSQQSDELVDLYHQRDFRRVEEQALRPVARLPDPVAGHFQKVAGYVDTALIRSRRFRVAVDGCNGVGAAHSMSFLRDVMGCEVVMVFGDPHGRFEREPEPRPENLGALSAAVTADDCVVGFAQDPDGDRLALVDETGRPIGEDLTLAFAIDQVLEFHGTGPVVVNLSSSRRVIHAARRHGAEPTLTRIGEINVVSEMLARGAVVGGEPNGGVILPAVHPCRDSYSAMALVLERLACTGLSISALSRDYPTTAVVKRKIRIRGDQAPLLLRALRRRHEGEKINLLDGVHITFADGMAHVRPSNTEPVLRIETEAAEPARAQSLADDLEAFLRSTQPAGHGG